MKYDNKESLSGRMKQNYEQVFKYKLPERMPVIIRLDGRAFHTLTAKAEKPFDHNFITMMNETAIYLCKEIQGCQLAYVQSDEISLLLHNYKQLNSQSWFNNEIQKMCSISAGLASAYFSLLFSGKKQKDIGDFANISIKTIVFDSRCFVLPEAEVNNYFVWRQKDWERNSIQMLAQSLYSHKELHKKNNSELQELCFQKGKNWNDLDVNLKRGRCCIQNPEKCLTCNGSGLFISADTFENCYICHGTGRKSNEWIIDKNIPIFSQSLNYIEKYLKVEEE
jgi:tRNA(His) 5'-end guanylyltransferase